jgi:hypothetical protein
MRDFSSRKPCRWASRRNRCSRARVLRLLAMVVESLPRTLADKEIGNTPARSPHLRGGTEEGMNIAINIYYYLLIAIKISNGTLVQGTHTGDHGSRRLQGCRHRLPLPASQSWLSFFRIRRTMLHYSRLCQSTRSTPAPGQTTHAAHL